jgi:hypothetical protein
VLSTDDNVFDTFSDDNDTDGQKLLFRNIYMRAIAPIDAPAPNRNVSLVEIYHRDGSVWFEDVTLQGNWLAGSNSYLTGLSNYANTTSMHQSGTIKPP